MKRKMTLTLHSRKKKSLNAMRETIHEEDNLEFSPLNALLKVILEDIRQQERDILYPHYDAIVVTMIIASFEVNRNFIVLESYIDILFKRTLEELGIQ